MFLEFKCFANTCGEPCHLKCSSLLFSPPGSPRPSPLSSHLPPAALPSTPLISSAVSATTDLPAVVVLTLRSTAWLSPTSMALSFALYTTAVDLGETTLMSVCVFSFSLSKGALPGSHPYLWLYPLLSELLLCTWEK